MGLFLANPWGLLALLGVPGVIAIHLLRRKSRQVTVSTLFLVERVLPSSEGGRRIRTLRNSLPLWVQILAVCALSWLFAQPRWIDASSVQTVAIVVDSSASLSAFREPALEAAKQTLTRLGGAAAKTQWIFLGSDATRLASGPDLTTALREVETGWQPDLGTHDTTEAFRLARTLAGPAGTVAFLTDHLPEAGASAGVVWIAAGHPIENAGFLGAQADAEKWTTLVKNFGARPKDVRWRVAGETDWRTMRLEPGAMTEVAGAFPATGDRLTLELEPDAFPFDDRLPLIKPREKPLALQTAADETYKPLFEQIASLAGPAATGSTADVSLAVYNPLKPAPARGAAVIFVEDFAKAPKPLAGALVAENHPLMEGLSWQGLIARDSFEVPFEKGDSALLWQGERPLIFLRETSSGPQMIFNFDVRKSNAARLPAFPLLLHRFFGRLREKKIAYAAANIETRQAIQVAGVGPVRAPSRPDFLSVATPDGTPLFDGAVQFGDSRESDFHAAASGVSGDETRDVVRLAHARGEEWNPLWLGLVAGLMLWNWWLTGRPRAVATGPLTDPVLH